MTVFYSGMGSLVHYCPHCIVHFILVSNVEADSWRLAKKCSYSEEMAYNCKEISNAAFKHVICCHI